MSTHEISWTSIWTANDMLKQLWKSKHWLFCGFILAGFARMSFCSLEMIWKNWGCSSIVEPIRSMHEAIGPIPSTSRQQQKEWSGGASECRHVRLSQTSELPLLEHHTLSWSWSLWLGRIQGSLIRLPAFRRTDWSCAPVTLVPF